MEELGKGWWNEKGGGTFWHFALLCLFSLPGARKSCKSKSSLWGKGELFFVPKIYSSYISSKGVTLDYLVKTALPINRGPVKIFMRSNLYGPFYDPKLYLSDILQLCAGFAEKGRSHLNSSCQDPFGSLTLPSPTSFPAFAAWPFTPLTVHCKLRSVVIVILWTFCLLGTSRPDG